MAELEWVLSKGAKVIALRPGPQYGRSPSDPYFDPFWARLNEAGGSVAFHLTESGYNEMVAPYWGYEANPSNFAMSAWQWTNCYGDRPIMETLSALVFENFFGRFPNITAVSVENGAEWAPYLVRLMNKMRGMGRNGPWIGGKLPARPPEIFAQHILVTPYPEDDVAAIVRDMGSDSIVLGSDWPHAEGLPQPADFMDPPRNPPRRRPAQDHARQRAPPGGLKHGQPRGRGRPLRQEVLGEGCSSRARG